MHSSKCPYVLDCLRIEDGQPAGSVSTHLYKVAYAREPGTTTYYTPSPQCLQVCSTDWEGLLMVLYGQPLALVDK